MATTNNVPFVNLTFREAYVATAWNSLFKQAAPQEPGENPYYILYIMLHINNASLQELQAKLQEYAAAGYVQKFAKPVVRELDEKLADEIEYLQSKGKQPNQYRYLTLRNRSQEPHRAPVLRSPSNQNIVKTEANYRFFKRGTQVNVKATLGVNKGQPYFILHGVQYVAPGFSDSMQDAAPAADFDVISNSCPEGMVTTESTYYDSNLGMQVTTDCTEDPNF